MPTTHLCLQLKLQVVDALLEAGHGSVETISSLARLVLPRLGSDHSGQLTEPLFQLRHLLLPDKYFIVATAQEVVKLNLDAFATDGVVQLLDACQLVWPPFVPNSALKVLLARHILGQYLNDGTRSESPHLAVSASAAGE